MTSKRILITGAGMLGHALTSRLNIEHHQVFQFAKDQLDVTNYSTVQSSIEKYKPEIVIHSAAYAKVDLAETEKKAAFSVNQDGTANVARACAHKGIAMLYVSTDYVFDGFSTTPYKTSDPTNPLSVYGQSKLAGELAVKDILERFYILRTSWLYGLNGKNFVDTMLSMAKERNEIQVVADQFGSPTFTGSLAGIIAELITTDAWGLYHASDDGEISWYDFARAILSKKNVLVSPIESCQFSRPAPRPKYSVLDKSALTEVLKRPLTPWNEALQIYLNEVDPCFAN